MTGDTPLQDAAQSVPDAHGEGPSLTAIFPGRYPALRISTGQESFCSTSSPEAVLEMGM